MPNGKAVSFFIHEGRSWHLQPRGQNHQVSPLRVTVCWLGKGLLRTLRTWVQSLAGSRDTGCRARTWLSCPFLERQASAHIPEAWLWPERFREGPCSLCPGSQGAALAHGGSGPSPLGPASAFFSSPAAPCAHLGACRLPEET